MARARRGDESNFEESQEETSQKAELTESATSQELPKDYSFSASNGVFTCKACQQSKHTDPVKGKELCPVADSNCPRNS